MTTVFNKIIIYVLIQVAELAIEKESRDIIAPFGWKESNGRKNN